MGRAHRTSSSLTCLCSFTQLVKNPLQCRRPLLDSWVKKFPWRRNRLPTPVFLGFPGGSDSKESACSAGDLGSIPGLRRSPGGGKGYPLQYSGLKSSMDRGAWQATVHGVTKSWTWLSNFHFTSLPLFLWISYDQTPWPSKSSALGAAFPYARPPGWGAWPQFQKHSVGNLSYIFQFIDHSPGGYEIWLYCKFTPPTILLWLCLWM